MSQNLNQFIHGMLAEKARLASNTIAEILAEMPDDLLKQYQEKLQDGVGALQHVYIDLRREVDPK
jgi:hypothetical protein